MALRVYNFVKIRSKYIDKLKPKFSNTLTTSKPAYSTVALTSHLTSVCIIKRYDFKQFTENTNKVHTFSALNSKIVPYVLSDIGEGIVEVKVKEWFVKPGDKISQFEDICEVQSDKASVTITSRFDGIVKKLHYDVDDTAFVGKPLIDVAVEDSQVILEQRTKVTDTSSNPILSAEAIVVNKADSLTGKVLATPAVRRIASENKIDLNLVTGTGKDLRVTKEDVLLFIERQRKGVTSSPSTPLMESANDVTKPASSITKAMIKSMTTSWAIPHFTYCDEVDVMELFKIKQELIQIGTRHNVKITYMPFFIKSASLALQKYPIINSTFDSATEEITFRSAHNIGVAVDTPQGLIVPNIKNVERKGVVEIAKELNRLQERGLMGHLNMDDLKDGTFTLSNIGAIGGTYAVPIIFAPQVAIGAVGKVQILPRFDESKNVIEKHIMNVSWSGDHRVLDGATIARFSNLWKLYVESPKLVMNI